jgi:hypothetical protein
MALKVRAIDLAAGPPSISTEMVALMAKRILRATPYVTAMAIPCWTFWRLTKELLLKATGIGYDEQFFMWGGWSILKGLAPYKDFIEFKPPMTFLTHALALKLFGYEGERFRYLFFALGFLAVAAFTASLLSRGADVVLSSALGLAVVYSFTHPGYHEVFLADTESIGLSYYLLGVACLIVNTRYRRAAEIIGGAFLTCTAFSKEPFMPCVGATWMACYFVVYRRLSKEDALRYAKNTFLGVGAVIAALCLYMIPTGAMSAYIATVRGYVAMFRDPQKGYCVLLGQFAPKGRFLDDLPAQIDRLRVDFFNPVTLGFVGPLFLASLVFVPRRSWALFVTSLLAMIFALYGVTASHCYFTHYYLVAQSGFSFFLAVGVDAASPALSFVNGGVRQWARAVALLMVAVHVWPRIDHDLPVVAPKAWAPFEPAPGLYDFIREHTAPADKIFTTGPPSLYVYADRIAAVRESSIIDELVPAMPGNTDEEKLRPLYDELVKNQPKVVFLDPEHGHRKYRHMAAAITPFLTEHHYVKINEQLYLRP